MERVLRSSRDKALEAYLAASARIGDRRSAAALAAIWHPRFLAHAWRLLGDRDLAREAAQDAWTEIIGGLPRLRDAEAFPAWSLRIVTRRCARLIRKRQSGRALAQAVANEPPPENRADPDRSADAERIRRAMADLPPEQRAAVWLFYQQDLSIAEIAVALDVAAGTVKTRLMHARRKLRGSLDGDENEQSED